MDTTNPVPELDRLKLRAKIAKERRWLTWLLDKLASIEGQCTHRIEEHQKLEARLLEEYEAARQKKEEEAKEKGN